VRVLITGVAGQDGTILATKATNAGDEVVGLIKPGTDPTELHRYAPATTIVECDLADVGLLRSTIREVAPNEIYNLGGWSTPGDSWENQELVQRINVEAVAAMIEESRKIPDARMFQAASAAIFEGADVIPQTERTDRSPQTPYAQSKADAMDLIDDARDKGLFAVSGILYNHESPIRGDSFVTRRITKGVARIAAGLQETLELGDIEVARDWGWAPDYVRAMRLMLRADVPHDYVLATGISHRLAFFLEKAFGAAGVADWRGRVVTNFDRVRKADTNKLVGDSHAAYTELGWRHTVDFDSIAKAMLEYDIELLHNPQALWHIA